MVEQDVQPIARFLRFAEAELERRDFLRVAGAASALALGGPLLAACGGSGTGPNAAKERYPVRPVNLIAGYGAGGGSDQLARRVAPFAQKKLGQSFPVLNVPGANGAVGMEKLVSEPADGYSAEIYIADTNTQVAAGSAKWKLSDLQAVARLMLVPSFLFVAEKARWKTIDQLIDDAKANPGKLKVATVGRISVDEVTVTFVEQKSGAKFKHIPFSKPAERYQSVISGESDVLYEQGGDVRQFLANNQMRPLVIFRETRLTDVPQLKDVPSSKEKGWDIFFPQFRGVVIRAGTSKDKLDALDGAFKAWSDSDDYKKFGQEQLMDPESFAGPDQFQSYMKSETDKLRSLMVQMGIVK